VQELRKQAGLELDARIELWLDGDASFFSAIDGLLSSLADDTLADAVYQAPLPEGAISAEMELGSGRLRIGLRKIAA
jgi:hypothetical protein